MKRLALVAVIFFVSTFLRAQEPGEARRETAMEAQMDTMKKHMRSLRRLLRSPEGAAKAMPLISEMQSAAWVSKQEVPLMAQTVNDDDKAEFLRDFRLAMIRTERTLLDLEGAVLEGDLEEAQRLHQLLKGHRESGHEQFTAEDFESIPVLTASSSPPGAALPAAGYTDTPQLPGLPWKVHDKDRPVPPFVHPAQESQAPSDAIVLFNGSNLNEWRSTSNKEANWKMEKDWMEVNRTGDIHTAQNFGDCQLHLEWSTPTMTAAGQGANNSGIYFMGFYEVQILDSWSSRTYADGQAGALYGQNPPDVNASLPPGEWQSYDIVFQAPHFQDEELQEPARVTVFHNGVLVHHDRAFLGRTTHRKVPQWQAHAAELPLRLQDHGNPVRFRNIWIRPLTPASGK